MVISEATRAGIEKEIAKYPARRGAMLPSLHLIQHEHGHVPPEAMRELAEILEVRPIDVMEVVSFYNMFHATPQARHHVYVCTNLPCSLRGARELLKQMEAHLGVSAGESTEDGRVALGHEECLGACGYAPMMRVGAQYHENLDFEQVKQILDGLD